MITFCSDSLNSKWGFGDGDMLDEILWGAGFQFISRPLGQHLSFEHEVLARAVEKFLLPLIPLVEVDRIGCNHNPIRAQFSPALGGVSVDVEEADILRIAEEVAPAYRLSDSLS